MMNTLLDTLDNINDTVNDAVVEHMRPVKAAELGLDPRSYYGPMYVSTEGIAVEGATRTLNYYGGFEYVDDEDVRKYGNWTLYTSESERVRDHLYRILSEGDSNYLRREYGEFNEELEDSD
jgi:hypothetical protein